ncbi:hypothetical protein, partial [Streptomyces mirabilis]|uniref:hypothetical protein n=1 Tax=Streptomyces mirabilis TaxID=68239 RepID=UPI0033A0E8A6
MALAAAAADAASTSEQAASAKPVAAPTRSATLPFSFADKPASSAPKSQPAQQVTPNFITDAIVFENLRGLAFSGQASDCLFHAAIRNFSYSAWTSRGG